MGASFSAPFVSGGAGVVAQPKNPHYQSSGAAAVAHAVSVNDGGMGYGRLDLVRLSRQCLRELFTGLHRFCGAHPARHYCDSQTTSRPSVPCIASTTRL